MFLNHVEKKLDTFKIQTGSSMNDLIHKLFSKNSFSFIQIHFSDSEQSNCLQHE